MCPSLLVAMMEGWRLETFTFEFPCIEAEITLEDIDLIVGFPIEGVVITGRSQIDPQRVISRLVENYPVDKKDIERVK
ncbi:hypothetical protein J1N35_043657 [Gossypium stocksii]|uniref:Aminotransferase-like plant mobile domain-containing protein n=1 Tax=Gossypium stocksii TaxID=47602 RepID=A0A9D3U7T3_9ROSI|nr:hypothetical protein J1N35_043657 [Gossypium stocksii]